MVALTPWSPAKRAAMRAALAASPLVLSYSVVGWGAGSAIFQPVHTLRSVVDSKADPSTLWRDLENYDLFFTLRHNALLGTGYGHGYVEIVWLPDISNSVRPLSLPAAQQHSRPLGLRWPRRVHGAVDHARRRRLFLAARAYRHAVTVDDRTAALTAVSVLAVYLVYCYGDLGLGTWTSVFTVAPALAIASRLAVRLAHGLPQCRLHPTGVRASWRRGRHRAAGRRT